MTMTIIGAVATLIVAGSFAVGAVAKSFRIAEFEQHLAKLVPMTRGHERTIATGVIIAEFALALSLVMWGSWAAYVSAIALLAVFTLVIFVNLAHGNRSPCGCFGDSTPISGWTLWRNALLILSAMLPLPIGAERVLLKLSVAELAFVSALAIGLVMTWLVVRQLADVPLRSEA